MRIGELARASGYSDKTLRYYEQIGLLRPKARTHAGYRVYGRDATERLRFVKNAQSLGLSLNDIIKILDITDSGSAPCGHMLTVVDEQLAQISSQMERLESMRKELSKLRAKVAREVKSGSSNAAQGCRCVGEIAPRLPHVVSNKRSARIQGIDGGS